MYDSFDHLTAAARAVRNVHGTDSQAARDMILEAVTAANGGVVTTLVKRVATWQAGRGHGTVRFRGKIYRGKGQRPARSLRPNATKEGLDRTRWNVVFSLGKFAEQGVPHPTVKQIQEFVPVSASAIRSARCRAEGKLPPLVAKARAALSQPAQDLIEILEASLPKGAMTVVTVASAQRRLWEPSANASTRRSHKARFKRIVDEMNAAYGIGINVRIVGDDLFVGRGRAIPDNMYAWARENIVVRRKLPDSLWETRGGLWHTSPGQVAQDLMYLLEGATSVVTESLAALVGYADDERIGEAEEYAEAMAYLVSQEEGPKRLYWQKRYRAQKDWIERHERGGAAAIAKLLDGYNKSAGTPEGGLSGMWKIAREMPGFQAPDMRTRQAQRWMDRIAATFRNIPDRPPHEMRFYLDADVWEGTPRHLRGERPVPPAL